MVAGLKIENDFGTIQIDETYSNFVFIEKGTVISKNGYGPDVDGNYWMTEIEVPHIENDILAIRCDGYYCTHIGRMAYSDGSGGFEISDNTTFRIDAPNGISAEFYRFRDQSKVSPINQHSGLVIRNQNNFLTYSSDFRTLKISEITVGVIDVVNHTIDGEKDVTTKTLPSGKIYASSLAFPAGYYWYYANNGFYSWVTYNSMIKITGNQMKTARLASQSGAFRLGTRDVLSEYKNPNYTALAIDVTDY